ncbi:MAG: hypothetical protein ACLP50_12265 [Solirubrobacteraceae bacterium]
MSDRALEAPTVPPPSSSSGGEPTAHPERSFARRRVWWLCAAVVVVVSVVLVLWARTRPGFDPYGWLVWGHQTLLGALDTNAAPSWKPLPYLFTVPFALTGHHELRLWMFTSAAVALAGVVFAGRIAYRLTDAPPDRRWAAFTAAAVAGLGLLVINNYFHYILSSQSDPMIVALCLGAIDCQLDRRPRTAFVLGALAALGRPEVWPFLGLFSLWSWRALPSTRWLLAGGWVAIALLWFGIPAITARTPFVSAANALDSGRRLTSDQVGGTITRFLDITPLPLKLAALLGVVLAAWRRNRSDRITLILAAGVVGWIVIESGFALHGWPGLERYMFEAAGVMIVLAGICIGRLLADPPKPAGIPSWVGAVVAGILVLALIPPAVSVGRAEHKDIREQRVRTTELGLLTAVIDRLGGTARVRACGEPVTRLEYQTALAYALGDNVSQVGFKYGESIAHGNPIVIFTPDPAGVGWVVEAEHQIRPSCRSLPVAPS